MMLLLARKEKTFEAEVRSKEATKAKKAITSKVSFFA